MSKTYRVELSEQAAYYAEVEVLADSPEDAKLVALEMDDLELDWDYSGPGGETEVGRVVDYEAEEVRHRNSWAKDQEQLAKEARVVAKPFHATRLSDGLAVEFVPGDVVTNLSNPHAPPLRFEFDSAHGRCAISYDEVFRQTGWGRYRANDTTQQSLTPPNLDTSTLLESGP
jgi:hypothetical protein